MDSMRAALASYSDWLKDIKNDVTDSSSRSAQVCGTGRRLVARLELDQLKAVFAD